MKTFALSALVALTVGVAYANDGAVESCGDVPAIETLESTDAAYTEPCNALASSVDRRYVKSDYFTVFKTYEKAEENCNIRDYIQGVYNRKFQLIGYACAPGGNDNGGGGN